MKPATHPDAQRVQSVLGPRFAVLEFEVSTKTSAEAAAAVGCEVAQIAKSIVLKTAKDQRPVLVIASGVNRIDEKKVSAALGEKVKSADAVYVTRTTGFAPGGVPPVGHRTPPVVFVDRDLERRATIWAAGGTANAVFETNFRDLVQFSGARVADVAKST